MEVWLWILAGVLLAAMAAVLVVRARRPKPVAELSNLRDTTTVAESGAVRSVQSADLTLPVAALQAIWTPTDLERLARTYWRYLSRATLRLIRVVYTDRGRFVVLLTRPFVLLHFRAPEYEMDARSGVVRWRIEHGVLVSRRGRGGKGHLEISVHRAEPVGGEVTAHVEVEVENFYPAIASALPQWIYSNTQSRIHVLVTHGFLRSLARLDLADSRVGRFSAPPTQASDEAVFHPPDDPAPAERAGDVRRTANRR